MEEQLVSHPVLDGYTAIPFSSETTLKIVKAHSYKMYRRKIILKVKGILNKKKWTLEQ